MTTKKPSPTASKKPTPAGHPAQKAPAKSTPTTPQGIDGATLADILAVLKGIDAKLGELLPKPLEKL